jgi:hypothetical protein
MVFAQPDTLWTRTYGGPEDDECNSIQQTSDGGFILAGFTESFGAGMSDFYVVKTDENGDTLWTRTFGGSEDDVAYAVLETLEGDFLVAGYTESFGAGSKDFYLVKTDESGDTLWTRAFGGTEDDVCYSMIISYYGNYIMAGYTESYGAGQADMYLLDVTQDGNLVWENTYGTSDWDECRSVQQTEDSDYPYILGGRSSAHIYLVRTNGLGLYDEQTIDISDSEDCCNSICPTDDDGFILGGTSPGPYYTIDMLFMKMGDWYNTDWINVYNPFEMADVVGKSVVQTSDGGFIIGGSVESYRWNGLDSWIIKKDASGNQAWFYCNPYYPNYFAAGCNSIIQTGDGGYAFGGYCYYTPSAPHEMYMVKLAPIPEFSVELTYVSGSPVHSGGSPLCFDIFVSNDSGEPQDFDVWLDWGYAGGYLLGQWFNVAWRSYSDFQPGSTINRPGVFWEVPAGLASAGYKLYSYLRVGIYPDHIWHQSYFPWEMLGSDQTAGTEPSVQVGVPNIFGDIEQIRRAQIPMNFALPGAHPNPFNPTTTISYKLPVASYTTLTVFDVQGREVARLVNGWRGAGLHEVTFDASNLASGIYLYRLEAGNYNATGKMAFMK